MTPRSPQINTEGGSLKRGGPRSTHHFAFAPESLIATFDRIEIELNDSKQRTKQISNRNKNGASGFRQLQETSKILINGSAIRNPRKALKT